MDENITPLVANQASQPLKTAPFFADGGEVDLSSLIDEPLEIDEEVDDATVGIMDRANEILDVEQYEIFQRIVEMHPELPEIVETILMSTEEFTNDGMVEGPGNETSDSIPARLSDGEFVFTAKSVKQIGVDKLMKMMKKAEEEFDASNTDDQNFAMGGLVQRKCK
jgi:hypothetical protein